MTTNPTDGGPAFPSGEQWTEQNGGHIKQHRHTAANPGMSLRDWFAGQALVAEIHTACISKANARALAEGALEAGHGVIEHIAFNAYRVADAMLAARERKGTNHER